MLSSILENLPFGSPQKRAEARRQALSGQLNATIRRLIAASADPNFPAYVAAVDAANRELFPALSRQLGQTQAQLLLLKLSNILIARYECEHRRTSVISSPLGLVVDPSNACTLRCPGCVHSDKNREGKFAWPSGNLHEDVFQTFLNRYGPYAFDLSVANWGEPLLNRNTPHLVELARRFMLPTYASTSLSVRKFDWDALVKSGLSFLILSIDGATEEIYLKYRRRGEFDLVLENLKRLVEAKKRLNSYTPVLHWQFLRFKHNAHEERQAIELARELGVNQIQLTHPHAVDWDDPDIVIADESEDQITTFESDATAQRAHLDRMADNLDDAIIAEHYARTWTDRLADLKSDGDETTAGPTCTALYKMLTLDARGRILPCCRPPSAKGDLLFSQADAGDPYNSDRHREARLFFADKPKYDALMASQPDVEPAYCADCTHLNRLDITTEGVVYNNLRGLGLYALLDEESRLALTRW